MITRGRGILIGALLLSLLGACSGQLPPPQLRSIVIYSGDRIQTDAERMSEVERWLLPQMDHIDVSRAFLIRIVREDVAQYPWDTLEITADTAQVSVWTAAVDAETPYLLYAHYRLIQEKGTLAEWAPEAEGLDGIEAEMAILARIADVWLLGRTAFDTQAFGPMDELVWSNEYGYLRDFTIATQGDRFAEEQARYAQTETERAREFGEWFLRTFEREGPGYLRPDSTVAEDALDVPTAP